MNRKFIFSLIACVLLLQNAFAQLQVAASNSLSWNPSKQEKWNLIHTAKKIYVLPTGDSYIDNLLEQSLDKYFTVLPYELIKDKTVVGEKVPIIAFLNYAESKTPGYLDRLDIVFVDTKDIKRNYFAPDHDLVGVPFNLPNDKTPLRDMSYMIPIAVKGLNDEILSEKKGPGAVHNESSSVLKDKTLLIPQEVADQKQSRQVGSSKTLIPEKSLTTYRYTYKIMPFNQIKTLLEDSSESSKYCVLSLMDSGPGGQRTIDIYDCDTGNEVLNYTASGMMNLMTDTDFKKISDLIDGATGTRKK